MKVKQSMVVMLLVCAVIVFCGYEYGSGSVDGPRDNQNQPGRYQLHIRTIGDFSSVLVLDTQTGTHYHYQNARTKPNVYPIPQ